VQSEENRKPIPLGNCTFPEENFIDFVVLDGKKIIKLNTYRYLPPSTLKPIAVFVVFHGLNSHIGNNAHVAKALSEFGIITVGFDHRGFGKSEGNRGFIASIE